MASAISANKAELIAQVGEAVQTTSNTLMTAQSTMQMLRQLPATVLDEALSGLPVDKVQAMADAYVVMNDAVQVYRDAEYVLRKAQQDAAMLGISPSELLRHKANAAAMHGGIDLAGPVGTPIYATADGIVGRSEWNNGGYGNLVEINHGQGIQTRYGHMSRRLVEAGTRVRRGQLIGLMGSTGRSTGSHLHYEVRIDGKPVNPIPFMKSTDYLLAMQKNAGNQSMDAIALGGPTKGR